MPGLSGYNQSDPRGSGMESPSIPRVPQEEIELFCRREQCESGWLGAAAAICFHGGSQAKDEPSIQREQSQENPRGLELVPSDVTGMTNCTSPAASLSGLVSNMSQ